MPKFKRAAVTADRNLSGIPNTHTLKHTLSAHFSACTIGLQNLLSSPVATLIIVLTLGISLCLPASGYIILKNFEQAATYWDKGTSITLFLKHHLKESDVTALEETLRNDPQINAVHYQTPEAALKEFRDANDIGAFVDTLPNNPIPGVITLYPKADFEAPEALKALQARLQSHALVDQAVLDYEWVEKLNAFLHLTQALAWILSLVIGAGLILVICNTVRLALERHRDEIEVLSLIGATQAFIRRPFLYRGLWYGALGAMVAFFLILLFQFALIAPAEKLSVLYGDHFNLETIDISDTILLLLASLSLGWFGAWIAVWHQWRSLAPESALKP